MKKYISFLVLIVSIFSLIKVDVNANIDLIVSPIKYEITANPWSSIVRSAKLINRWPTPMVIHTWKSDFVPTWNSWSPKFIRKSELVNPDQELATWITIDTATFTINSLEEKEINFTIDVPTDATPGWHYWAVFFKNNWVDNPSWSWEISINVDYWVLLLINVDWEIIDNASPWNTNISSWWWYSWTQYQKDNAWKTDDCPLWDLTSSNIDWKCFDLITFEDAIEDIEEEIENNDDEIVINDDNEVILDETDLTNSEIIFNEDEIVNNDDEIVNDKEDNNEINNNDGILNNNDGILNNDDEVANIDNKEEEDFTINFWIPFKNEGNTHIKPEWQITLVDEDWNEIKWIWKEIIKNDQWAIIWEKIVDYIPINDIWWNVLPNSERLFNSEWKWFPYEAYDDNGKKVIEYWTPWEYYTKKNIEERTYIYPWERVNEKLEQKKIEAIIQIAYENYEWELIEFNSAEEFYVDYKTNYIWLNPYFILISIISFWLFLIFFIIFRKTTRKKCEKCKKSIKKKMTICPYCWTKQKNKK